MDINKIFLLFVFLILSACGGGDEGGTVVQCTKEINSQWASTDLGLSFNLSSFQIGIISSTLLNHVGGEVCDITLRISGSECTGSLIVTSSSYQGGGSGDPGCASYVGIKDYNIFAEEMQYCEPNTTTNCDIFE